MKNNRKALLLLLCAVLMVTASVFGTLAYLTDTDDVINTFTVGQVGLKLDEAEVNPDGTLKSEERVQTNEYHLLPGHTYVKDPTITVDSTSEDCYLFVQVENGIQAIETTDPDKTIAKQMADLGWKPIEENSKIFVYAIEPDEKTVVSKNTKVVVFNNFTIDGDKVVNGTPTDSNKVSIDDYVTAKDTEGNPTGDKLIRVTAYAVQKDGFEDKDPKQIWDTALAPVANP